MVRVLAAAIAACLIAACATAPVTSELPCSNSTFVIDAEFEGADLDVCKFTASDSVELTFLPEDEKVSDAFSWFAFRVTAQKSQDIRIKLQFPRGYARYWPKISDDGVTWTRAAANSVTAVDAGKSFSLVVTADADGTWVSAQELLTGQYYDRWLAELGAHNDLEIDEIGMSVEGRPIRLAKTAYKPEVIVLLGRQHPAEVPGALAMRDFVDVLLADTELAKNFRKRFTLLLVPLVNPDGVANGHSRHNAGAIDLNRDWGPFTQPETQSIQRVLAEIERRNMRPRLMLDFHATKQTSTMIYYTQMPDDDTEPPLFASTWLSRVDERIDDYEFIHDPRSPSGLDNTKNYFFLRYNIPAITYEIGDEADRRQVKRYTPIFAEEMMRTMLDSECLLRAAYGAVPCSRHLTIK